MLYMDNELSAGQKKMVDDFLLLHPAVQEELDVLLNTKLPAEEVVFSGKAELHSAAMRLSDVDELLLLYIDNELTAAERTTVEERMAADKDVRLQHERLQLTKLDAAEIIPYPNKKELYRHTEKVVPLFPVWMRIAVAVVLLLLLGSYFFAGNESGAPALPGDGLATLKPTSLPAKETLPVTVTRLVDSIRNNPEPQQEQLLAKTETVKPKAANEKRKPVVALPPVQDQLPAIEPGVATAAVAKIEMAQPDAMNISKQALKVLTNSVANLSVTSVAPASYNLSDNPAEIIVTDGDNKPKTPAKGFLRKVSRFIERRTGIGTVNADNELLIGSVALKLN